MTALRAPDLALPSSPPEVPFSLLPQLAPTPEPSGVLRHLPWARWLLLAAATGVAFNRTFESAAQQAHQGAPLAYLFLLPLWGAVLAVGTQLRRRQELPIHDRQVDWIVAVTLAVGLWMLDVLLAPRLGATANLVRVDVFGMLLFVVTGSVLLFGTRATGRYWATWLFLAACWPLAYQLIGAGLGGSDEIYATMNVALTAVVLGVARGGRLVSRLLVAALTMLVGTLAVILLGNTPQLVISLVPAGLAMSLVLCIGLATRWRPGLERRWAAAQEAAPHRPAVGRARAASVAVVLLALLIVWRSDMTPPTLTYQSLPRAGAGWTAHPVVPAGWRTIGKVQYSWTPRYFGLGASWQRFDFAPEITAASNAHTTSEGTVVDALTAPTAGPLSTYPAVACYRLNTPYLESSTPVRLGHGVKATLYYANSAAAQSAVDASWTMLTWVWRIPQTSSGDVQRITVFAPDGISGRLGVPVPASPGANDGIRTTFSNILRGASTVGSPAPNPTALRQVTQFSRELVNEQAGTVVEKVAR